MTSANLILNPHLLEFLNSTHVVYDPFYRKCSQDFSGLENCQVIFLGEYHSSGILKAIQEQFLRMVIGNRLACLVVEGLTIGQTAKAQEFQTTLPENLVMRGGDIRAKWTFAQFREWDLLNRRVIQLESEDRRQVSGSFGQVASLLNDSFQTNPTIDSTKKKFLVSDSVQQAVDHHVEELLKQKEQRDQEIEKIHRQMNHLSMGKKVSHATVVQSNERFFAEILKAAREFSLILGMWGKGHFICDDAFLSALHKAQLSYVILFPKEQLESQALDEINWGKGTLPTVELTVSGSKEETTLTVPKLFQSYFHPSLQGIAVESEAEKEPIILDLKKVLSQQSPKLDFPADQPVHFENPPLADYHHLEELFHVNTKLNKEQAIVMRGHLISILNNILMLGHRKIASLTMEGNIECHFESKQNKPVIVLSSDKPFSLTVAKNTDLFGYADYLLREMKRLGQKEFSISPNERLFFFDLSIEKRDQLLQSPETIVDWLESKLPPKSQLTIVGDLTLHRAQAQPFAGHPYWEGIVLTTSSGFKIELT